jgi:hypothetical protein
MRMALRMLALLVALSVVFTVMFIVQFNAARLKALTATGALGIVTYAGWVLTLLIGPFAAIQLLRLRNNGRIAAAILFGIMATYYILGAWLFREPGTPIVPIAFTALLCAMCMSILLLPQARAVCLPPRE